MDPHNGQAAFSKEAELYWGPVDLYVGGAAHAVMHLLYARFWHKVFFDAGLVHTKEPFQKLYNQGMLTAFAYEDSSGRLVASDEIEWHGDKPVRKAGGEPLAQIVTKMAKSLKNVVNPDDVIAEQGCDAFRLYELFMGPLDESKPWNTRDIPGCRRFCERVWRLFVDPEADAPVRANLAQDAPVRADSAQGAPDRAGESDVLALERALARMLAKAEESFRHFNFNTAIAAMMTFLNEAQPLQGALSRSQGLRFLACLAPFAPHMAEELWHRMGEPGSVTRAPWPLAEARFLERDELEIPVQVLGKLRGKITVPKASTRAQIESAAREAVAAHLSGKEVVKVVYVEGRLVNFVVK
jgi:leucyl-tRNA synthetase